MKLSLHLPQIESATSFELLGGYWVERSNTTSEAFVVMRTATTPGIEFACSLAADKNSLVHRGRFATDTKRHFDMAFDGESWESNGKTFRRMDTAELLNLTEGQTFKLKG